MVLIPQQKRKRAKADNNASGTKTRSMNPLLNLFNYHVAEPSTCNQAMQSDEKSLDFQD